MPLKNRIFIFSILFIGILVFFSYKNKKASTKTDNAAYNTEEFLIFYDRFSKDSVYQMEHIVFPLEGKKAPVDSLYRDDDDFRWNTDGWILQKEYDDVDGTFSREFLDINGLIIERIGDVSGKFTMERRFGRLSSGWHLIYYREMGMY